MGCKLTFRIKSNLPTELKNSPEGEQPNKI